jgi:nucleotide-binding universal stress UspA family protein
MDRQHRGRTVVVGIDGTESALHAVRWAALEAARRRAPPACRDGLRVDARPPGRRDRARQELPDIMLDESRRLLREAAAVAARAADGLEVDQQLIVGFPIPVPRSPSVPSWS